jgi:dolichol-phosphate mannosyltransferase
MNNSIAIVIPVYNENSTILQLIEDTTAILTKHLLPFHFYIVNDGSTDNTPALLDDIAGKHSYVTIIHQQNMGHGPAILNGYIKAAPLHQWVWQMDSDYQLSIAHFDEFYSHFNHYDFLIANRSNKNASMGRNIISKVLSIITRLLYGKGVQDLNAPFRIMRSIILLDLLPKIEPDSFAPNTLMSAYFIQKKLRIYQCNVSASNIPVKKSNFNSYILQGSLKSFWQLIFFKWKI